MSSLPLWRPPATAIARNRRAHRRCRHWFFRHSAPRGALIGGPSLKRLPHPPRQVVTREASNFPFALVPAAGGGVGIGIPPGNARARGAGAGRVVDPKEVGAEVLRRLKAAAERKWPARSLFGAPRQRPPGPPTPFPTPPAGGRARK